MSQGPKVNQGLTFSSIFSSNIDDRDVQRGRLIKLGFSNFTSLHSFVGFEIAFHMATSAISDPNSAILRMLQIIKLSWHMAHGSNGPFPWKYLLTEKDLSRKYACVHIFSCIFSSRS